METRGEKPAEKSVEEEKPKEEVPIAAGVEVESVVEEEIRKFSPSLLKKKHHLKKQWPTPWVKGLIGADKEILESVQSGFFMITGVKRDEWFR